METFDSIRDKGLLLYEYLRGSHCHGIATELSDYDYGGIFVTEKRNLLDLGLNYQDQIANDTNDIVWYELKKFMTLLIKSNPTILESLFVDDKYVKYEHPLITDLKKHKDAFLTKKCFPSFFSYAKSQVEKARGLNKMINWERDKIERKGILDFTYTFFKQGSTKIENWLEYRNLKQRYCGLVNVPNMRDTYAVFYDWGNHFLNEGVTFEDLKEAFLDDNAYDIIDIVKQLKNDENNLDLVNELKKAQFKNMVEFIITTYHLDDFYGLETVSLKDWYDEQKPIGYRGMINEAETSNELRLSSVEKGAVPICHVSYNKDGYIKHCTDYKNYQDWIKHRNPIRYQSNLNKSYDAKNMCECFRLINCGIEIAQGKGFIVDRSGIDADFLLSIKNHKFEYEYLMSELEKKKEEMNEVMQKSSIPDDIDPMFVNELYYEIVNKIYL